MSIKADELISARKIIDLLIDVQKTQVKNEPSNNQFADELESLYVVNSILITADEYIFDDIKTEQEYRNKVNGSNYDN